MAALDNIDNSGDAYADAVASDALTKLLADAKNEVETKKHQQSIIEEIGGYLDSADNAAVQQIITEALVSINAVPFDVNKTEEENKAALDAEKTAAIIAINNARKEQYSAVLDSYLGEDADSTNVAAEATNGKNLIDMAVASANGADTVAIVPVSELQTIVDTAKLEMDKERAKNAITEAAGSAPTSNVQDIVAEYNTATTGVLDTQTTKEAVELARDKALAEIEIEEIREAITAKIDPDYSADDKIGAEADIDAAIDAAIAKLDGAADKQALDKIVEEAQREAQKALDDYDYNKINRIHKDIIEKTDIEASDLDAIKAVLDDIAALKDATKNKAYFEELRNELLEKMKDAVIAGIEDQKTGVPNVDAMADNYIAKVEAVLTSGDTAADEEAYALINTLAAKASDGIDFEEYKNEMSDALEDLKLDGDTSYVDAIIKAEQDRIAGLVFDEDAVADLARQKVAVDDIVAGVPAQLELQRFKDNAVRDYEESYKAVIGKELADNTAIYEKINPETTYAAVNEKLGEQIKALVKSLENFKDSDTVKGYISTVMDAVDDAVSAANGGEADISSVLKVTVGTVPTDIRKAVTEQRKAEKDAAKQSLLNDMLEAFGWGYTDIPDAMEIYNSVSNAIDVGKYADYNGILNNAKATIALLKDVEDYKQSLVDRLDALAGVDDSPEVKALIEEAKAAIENADFDDTKSLYDQITALENVFRPFEESIYAQRAEDYKAMIDSLVNAADGENVKTVADEAKTAVDALDKPTEEQLKEILEGAKADISVERFKDTYAGASDLLRKDPADITASDITDIKKAIEEFGKLDDATKGYLDASVSEPYTSYADELADRLAAAEFAKAKDEAVEKLESMLDENDGALVQNVNKEEIDKILNMTYSQQSEADRDNYIDSILDAVAKAEDAGVKATEHAQNKEAVIADATEALGDKKESGQYNDTQKKALDEIFKAFEAKVNSLPAATTDEQHKANEEQLQEWLDEAKNEMNDVSITAVAKGEIDLNNPTGAEYGASADGESNTGDTVWGIVTNDSSMPGGIQLVIEKVDEEKAAAVEDAISDSKFVAAEGSDLAAEQLADLVEGKKVESVLDIYLLKNNAKITEFNGVYTVKLLLTAEQRNMKGAQVIYVNDDGSIEVFETTIEDGKYLVFTTTHFSEFFILETPAVNLWWLIITLSVVALVELAAIALIASKKKKTKKNDVKAYSAAPVALLAANIVPVGGVWISIALGVLVVAAAAVLAIVAIKRLK